MSLPTQELSHDSRDTSNKNVCRVYKGIRFLPCYWSSNNHFVNKSKNPLNHSHKCNNESDVIEENTYPRKMIVFDLDETLGCFGDLFIMWSGVRHLHPSYDSFEALFDLYPEFLRYGILTILEFLYKKKSRGECDKIFIYTNNQCSSDWVRRIADNLQRKVQTQFQKRNSIQFNEPLFDQLICAYRIQSRPNESRRTSHRKTMVDFINCADVNETDLEICFVDDVEHRHMKESRVYYISPVPYYHSLTASQIVNRFLNSSLAKTYKEIKPLLFSKEFWTSWFSSYKRAFEHKRTTHVNVHIDLMVSQQLMTHIQDFIRWRRYTMSRTSTANNYNNNSKRKYTRKKKKGGSGGKVARSTRRK